MVADFMCRYVDLACIRKVYLLHIYIFAQFRLLVREVLQFHFLLQLFNAVDFCNNE